MSEYELREFICEECGHKVVVNPKLPKDYTPSCCMQCYETVVRPRLDRNWIKIAESATKLLKLMGMEP